MCSFRSLFPSFLGPLGLYEARARPKPLVSGPLKLAALPLEHHRPEAFHCTILLYPLDALFADAWEGCRDRVLCAECFVPACKTAAARLCARYGVLVCRLHTLSSQNDSDPTSFYPDPSEQPFAPGTYMTRQVSGGGGRCGLTGPAFV